MCTVGTARTLSAYLHRRGTASGSAMGPFTVLGRASPCSLDAAARERIMAGGGKGANRRGSAVSVGGWRGPFLPGTGVTCSVAGRGAARGQPGLPRPAGAVPRPATR